MPTFSTASSKVYRSLRTQITEGELQPGARLVRRRLSEEFGVSPIPVAEALLRLEIDGLVESEPMYGARVRTLTPEGVRDERILREAIECQAARLCARNATTAQLSDLSERAVHVDGLVQLREPLMREGAKHHLQFHLTVARYSGSQLLESELQRVSFWEYIRVSWVNSALFPVPQKWHQQLVAVLAERDPEQAEKKMREHVLFNAEHEAEALDNFLKSKPSLDEGESDGGV